MQPTSSELDTIADLLHRWQRVSGPMERVRVVSDAADALRDLSALDARALAQGLWEHGAGPAAQQVAQRTGTSVAPEELTDVASAVLSLDRAEVDRLADELRDPEQRRRLLMASGIGAEEATSHVAGEPPDDQQRIDAPPPPGAAIDAPPPPDADPTARSTSTADRAEVDDRQSGPSRASNTERTDGSASGGTPAGRQTPTDAQAEVAPVSAAPSTPPADSRYREPTDPARRLPERLREAPNGRERIRLLDEDGAVVHGAAVLRILEAVPDGWQRRTVLRKLVTADRVRGLPDATDVVTSFERDGDRFAAAALLVRTGTCAIDAVLPALDPDDAARLLRRSTTSTSSRHPVRRGA